MLSVQPLSVSFASGTKTVDGGNKTQRLEKEVQALIKAGKACHETKNMDKAIEAYSEAIEKITNQANSQKFDKLTAKALVLRGNAFRHLGNIDAAIADTTAARDIDPLALKYVRIY